MPAPDASIGSDGSGSIAIKMVHTDNKWSIVMDVIRLTFSIGLLIFSAISVFYAIGTATTTMPDAFPGWSQYLCLIIALWILGVLEGLQIAVVELAHKDPNQYRKTFPRAAKLLEFENKGRNVERFLMGRQVLVVFTVFIAARITTFNGFWADVPDTLIHSLMFSGFLGVILVVVIAQLTPQVLAAAYPVEFLNLYGMNIAFRTCLLVEATGLVHAVWFLCVTVRKMVYKCVCKKTRKSYSEQGFDKLASKSSLTPNLDPEDVAGGVMRVTDEMLTTAKQAEIDIEVEVELIKKQNDERDRWNAMDDHVGDHLESLIEKVGNNSSRDLFYIYGDNKYMSPSQCGEKFENAGLCPPHFLLPPDNIAHIPPHIVAMTLLKMYTEKCGNDDDDEDDVDNKKK